MNQMNTDINSPNNKTLKKNQEYLSITLENLKDQKSVKRPAKVDQFA